VSVEHIEWVRAAIRDKLGISDDGGTVTLTSQDLFDLAASARLATLEWMLAQAEDGNTHFHAGETDDPRNT
jgi:hypothetical protein